MTLVWKRRGERLRLSMMPMLSRLPGLFAPLLMLVLALDPAAARSEEKPSPGLDQQVALLIGQLGDKDFPVRQRAQEELAKLGFQAYDALSAATHHEDLEIATRARYLLGLMRMHWCTPSDPPEVRRQLEKYELDGVSGRHWRIQALTRLRDGAGIPALCRLVRYEDSELLSKYAALEILNWMTVDQTGQARLAQALREQLEPSKRLAARWLLTYEELQENSAAAEGVWLGYVESENSLAKSSPGQSNPGTVVTLLYHLAEAQARHGRNEQAEATARRALQLHPGNAPPQLDVHLKIAMLLQYRGLFKWADQEYQQVAQAGVLEYAYQAQVLRAEMWHDQGEHLVAAKSLEQAFQVLEQVSPNDANHADRAPGKLRARMNYFLACHWETQKDRTQQLKYLAEALENDKAEVDVLIACWHLKDPPPEFRTRIGKLIDRAATEFRRELASPSGDGRAYADYLNQFAWLVGNTQGNFDEALRYSLKSIELNPNNGAYYDTLAHVYFAKGDLAGAVKSQTRATELEPHSGLIRQALTQFRAAIQQKQNQPGPTQPNAKATAAP